MSEGKSATWTAGLGVAAVASTAAVISFQHVRTLTSRAGESDLTSWLLPVSIDGAIVAAVAVLLADSRAGRRPTALTWLLLSLGLAGSLAANIASAEPAPAARAVAAWPPIALALGIEVLSSLIRRTGSQAGGTHDGSHRTGGRHGQDSAAGISRVPPASPPGQELSDGPLPALNGVDRHAGSRDVLSDEAAVAMIRQLDERSDHGVASRLDIQQALGCGGSRAARLAGLARDRNGAKLGG